jgi:tetratricopeptide (TPR) repeat protein
MSKENNAARLAMIKADKEFKDGNFNDSATLYAEAAINYKAARNNANYQIALTNQGAALIEAGTFEECIEVLKAAVDAGLNSPELKTNLASAYYNLGRQQSGPLSLDEAITNFTEAKKYQVTAETCYQLGNALLLNGEFPKAQKEFTDLLDKNLPEDQFSLELKLNSYCQLISSQEKQGNPVDKNTLLDAQKVLKNILNWQASDEHKAEAHFISVRLTSEHLKAGEYNEALALLNEEEAAIPGIMEDSLKELEQFALHKNNDGDKKEALHMLWFIAENFNTPPNEDIAERSKAEATAIVDSLGTAIVDSLGKVRSVEPTELITKILGVGGCHHDDIDAYFA